MKHGFSHETAAAGDARPDAARAMAPALSETHHSGSLFPRDGHASAQVPVNVYVRATSGHRATICMNVEATRVHTVYPAVAIFHRIRRAWAGLIDQKPDVLLGYSNQIGIDGLAVGVGFSRGGFGVSPITGKFSLSRLLIEGRPAISSLWGLIDFPPRPSLPTAGLNRCVANICKYP